MSFDIKIGDDPGTSSRFIAVKGKITLGGTDYPEFPDRRTYIWANDCYLLDSVKAHELHLHTGSFTSSGKDKVFRLNGADGIDGTGSGGAGTSGDDGGDFYFTSAKFSNGSGFHVLSNGGNGGNGADHGTVKDPGNSKDDDSDSDDGKTGGDGGNGGNAGNINMLFVDNYEVAVIGPEFYAYEDAADKLSKDTGTDEDKTKELVANFRATAEAWLELLKVVIKSPQKVKALIVRILKEVNKADTTKIATDMADLNLLLNENLPGDGIANQLGSSISLKPGKGGSGGDGDPAGKDGTNGKGGSSTIQAHMDSPAIWDSSELLFHPNQMSMMLRDAYTDYFRAAGDGADDYLTRSGGLFSEIVTRLSFLDILDDQSVDMSDSNLWKAYLKNEVEIQVVPSEGSTPTSITSLRSTYRLAKTYLNQINSGLDIYGHPRDSNWVPRGSFTGYLKVIDTVLQDFDKVEQNYEYYKKKLWDQKSKESILTDAILYAKAAIDKAQAHRQQVTTQIKALNDSIESLNDQIPGKKNVLLETLKRPEANIRDHGFDISFKNFLDDAISFAFEPGLLMGAVVGGKVWIDSTQYVTNQAGDLVNKDWLISQIQDMNGTVQSLEDGLKMVGGMIDAGVAGGAKLVATEADCLKLLKTYRDLIGGSLIELIQAQFDDYTRTVLKRNKQVLKYNSNVIMWLQDMQTELEQQDAINKAEDQLLSQIDRDLPDVEQFIERAYFDTVDKIFKTLYMTERALEFWNLQDPLTNFDKIREGGILGGNNTDGTYNDYSLYSSFKSLRYDIETAYSDSMNDARSPSSKFGDWGEKAGANTAIRYQLTEDEWQPLQGSDDGPWADGTVVDFHLRFDEGSDTNPFYGRFDVRLTKVQLYLEGDIKFEKEDPETHEKKEVPAAERVVNVRFRHNGTETIIPSNKEDLRVFDHEQIEFGFSYIHKNDEENGGIVSDGKMFSEFDESNPNYEDLHTALCGPFTIWEINVPDIGDPKGLNPYLNIDGMTGARLEFTGYSRVKFDS
ncbi:hypothetical protein ABW19_dt0207191 [Dactylella cylindrospora]|nr:hypothetical protein ABW19_dt0207191 [Dactylella cylindrospora]